jgi:hypothetical protein
MIVRAIGATEMVVDAQGEVDATVMLQNPGPKVQISSSFAEGNVEAKKSFHSHGAAAADDIKWSAALAEYVAMTLFVVIGCGSAMGCAKEPGWILQVALTFGFAITSLAYAIGHYSGGQINCAVTLGLYLSGNLGAGQAICNFLAQMAGSITGALLLTMIIDEEKDKTGGIARNKVSQGYSNVNALFGEATMTFFAHVRRAGDCNQSCYRIKSCHGLRRDRIRSFSCALRLDSNRRLLHQPDAHFWSSLGFEVFVQKRVRRFSLR